MYETEMKDKYGSFVNLHIESEDLLLVYRMMEAKPTEDVAKVFIDLLGKAKNLINWTVTGVYPIGAILLTDTRTRNEIVGKLKDIGIEMRGGQN